MPPARTAQVPDVVLALGVGNPHIESCRRTLFSVPLNVECDTLSLLRLLQFLVCAWDPDGEREVLSFRLAAPGPLALGAFVAREEFVAPAAPQHAASVGCSHLQVADDAPPRCSG